MCLEIGRSVKNVLVLSHTHSLHTSLAGGCRLGTPRTSRVLSRTKGGRQVEEMTMAGTR